MLLLCYPFTVMPSAVLFLFHTLASSFLALVAQQHQVVFVGTGKNSEAETAVHCEGSFVILQSCRVQKANNFDWSYTEAVF